MDYYCPHVLGKVKYPNGYSLELAIEQQDLFMVECLYCPHVLGKPNRYSLELAIQQQDLFMVECLLHIGVSPETLVMIDVNHYTNILYYNYYSHVRLTFY